MVDRDTIFQGRLLSRDSEGPCRICRSATTSIPQVCHCINW